jgi:hypothetical protein
VQLERLKPRCERLRPPLEAPEPFFFDLWHRVEPLVVDRWSTTP